MVHVQYHYGRCCWTLPTSLGVSAGCVRHICESPSSLTVTGTSLLFPLQGMRRRVLELRRCNAWLRTAESGTMAGRSRLDAPCRTPVSLQAKIHAQLNGKRVTVRQKACAWSFLGTNPSRPLAGSPACHPKLSPISARQLCLALIRLPGTRRSDLLQCPVKATLGMKAKG